MVVRLVSVAAALLAAFVQRLDVAAYAATPLVIGAALALMWSGIALRQWCFSTLGRYFTFTVMTSADQRVVTSGPDRRVAGMS